MCGFRAISCVVAFVVLSTVESMGGALQQLGKGLTTHTEIVHRDDLGEIEQVRTVQETVVNVKRKVVLIQENNEMGVLRAVRRETSLVDEQWGSARIVEALVEGTDRLRVTLMETVLNDGLGGTTQVIKQLNDKHRLVLTSKTIKTVDGDKIRTVRHELNERGILVETMQLEQEKEVAESFLR